MYTRLTNQLMLEASKQNINDSLSRLYELQQKAATGKKYARSSENPAVTAQGISLRSTQNQLAVYADTIASTNTWLESTDLALKQMGKVLSRAQQLSLRGLDDSQGPDERAVMASEMDGLLQQALQVGNTMDRGRYIFSGLRTDTKPFVLASGSAGAVVDQIKVNVPVVASGSSIILNGIDVKTDASAPNTITVNGTTININQPFKEDGTANPDYPTLFVDGERVIPNPPTSASATYNLGGVSITATNSGSPQFTVAGSSITAGSPVVLTTSQSITVNFSGGAFTSSASFVSTGSPNSIYVGGMLVSVKDPTAATPAFMLDGQDIIPANIGFDYIENVTKHNGTAYAEDGTNFPTYRRDQVIYNGDANTINRSIAPNENLTVSISGGSAFNQMNGMFDTLIRLRDSLKGADYVSPHEPVYTTVSGSTTYQVSQELATSQPQWNSYPRTASILENQSPNRSILNDAYNQLISVTESVTEKLAINGNRMRSLTSATERSDRANLEISSLLSQNEEVNMAEAISNVNNQQNVYQTVLNLSGRVNSLMSLFDTLS